MHAAQSVYRIHIVCHIASHAKRKKIDIWGNEKKKMSLIMIIIAFDDEHDFDANKSRTGK